MSNKFIYGFDFIRLDNFKINNYIASELVKYSNLFLSHYKHSHFVILCHKQTK